MVWTNPKQLWGLIKESVAGWSDDYASSMGAAIAYYTLFSVAPLLVIVIAVAGLVFGQDAAQGAIFEQLRGLRDREIDVADVIGTCGNQRVDHAGNLGNVV